MSKIQTPADEPAHDILAAEAFAMPAPDPSLHHRPVVLPNDPTGITEPHDVLAAEEFAVPAARSYTARSLAERAESSRKRLATGTAASLLALWLLARILRRH